MELRHLRFFCAVAEEMHVTRAAERLGVAQPGLTREIKALEAELKTPLLRRAGRGVELTEAGSALWREAQSILDRVRAAPLLVQDTVRGLSGHIAIGLTETASFGTPVATLLKQAREQWPGVELSLLQGRTNCLVADLIDRRIDVAFIRSPAPDIAAVQCRPFLTESIVVVVPKTHPLASQRLVDIPALAGELLILPHARPGGESMEMRARLAAAFTRLGHALRVVQETPEYVMAINLVAAGLGVALVPAGLTGLNRDAVCYRPFRSKPPLLTDLLLISRAGDSSPTTANFLALADQVAPGKLRPSAVAAH